MGTNTSSSLDWMRLHRALAQLVMWWAHHQPLGIRRHVEKRQAPAGSALAFDPRGDHEMPGPFGIGHEALLAVQQIAAMHRLGHGLDIGQITAAFLLRQGEAA
ncbi:MAG: hypothetical protein QM796_10230 [Chthoniobacteraceae bacterium]